MADIELKPVAMVNNEWRRLPPEQQGLIPRPGPKFLVEPSGDGLGLDDELMRRYREEQESRAAELAAREQIEAVVIRIGSASSVTKLRSDSKWSYLKADFALNVLVPKGRIDALRLRIRLPSRGGVVATAGFPDDRVDERYLIDGKVTVALDKALQFIPLLAGGPLPVAVELGPWEFHLGRLRHVRIAFTGPLSLDPPFS